MNQSTVIFGSLMLLFVVYITSRGDLPKWLGLFRSKSTETQAASADATADAVDTAKQAIGTAKSAMEVAEFAAFLFA